MSLIKVIKALFKLQHFKIALTASVISFIIAGGGLLILQYWEPFLAASFTINEVNIIYIINILTNLVLAFVVGVVNDIIGRKAGLLFTIILTPVFIVICLLIIPIKNIILVSLTFGLFISAIWASRNTLGIVGNELIPTDFRGTMKLFTGILFIVIVAVYLFTFSFLVIFLKFEVVFLLAIIPGGIIGIILVLLVIPETKATDLTTVKY